MRLYIDLLLIRTLYLVPFARYPASKISVSDLDLSVSPKINNSTFLESPYATLSWCSVDTNSLSGTVCEIFSF